AQSEGWTALLQERGPGEEYRLLVGGAHVLAARMADRNHAVSLTRLHPALVERVVEAVRSLRLELAEVEVIAKDLAAPLEGQNGVIAAVTPPPPPLPLLHSATPSPA